MEAAASFFRWCLSLGPFVAAENPRMHIHAQVLIGIGPSTQRIQPWQFGHGEVKETHLWLRGLPALVPTKVVDGREALTHRCPPGPLRARIRSKTFRGVAEAMADQWGSLKLSQEAT